MLWGIVCPPWVTSTAQKRFLIVLGAQAAATVTSKTASLSSLVISRDWAVILSGKPQSRRLAFPSKGLACCKLTVSLPDFPGVIQTVSILPERKGVATSRSHNGEET